MLKKCEHIIPACVTKMKANEHIFVFRCLPILLAARDESLVYRYTSQAFINITYQLVARASNRQSLLSLTPPQRIFTWVDF